MSKHTPGPWKFVARISHGDYPQARIEKAAGIILDEGRGSQQLIFTGFSDRDEANARLIAAAPTMKEALEEVSVGLEFYMGRYGDNSGRLANLRGIVADALAKTE